MITVHCIIKNEENFIGYAIRSVINYVDSVIVFDTGSIDKTVEIVRGLVESYPGKIIFEEKGECDKKRHTELRQEMIDRTVTEWFMILDGDEVWTKRGMEEAKDIIEKNDSVECLVAPFYLCVGDVYHYSDRGKYEILGKKIHATFRFFKKVRGIKWEGQYGADSIYDIDGESFCNDFNSIMLSNKFWHLSHLNRSGSSAQNYTSGGLRRDKLLPTYFIVGSKIPESIPESFDEIMFHLNLISSIINFFIWIIRKLTKNFGN